MIVESGAILSVDMPEEISISSSLKNIPTVTATAAVATPVTKSKPAQWSKVWSVTLSVVAFLLMPAIWIGLKYVFHVSDRYLPSPIQVIQACSDIEPNILVHTAYTTLRLFAGFIIGVLSGFGLGILANRSQLFARLVGPMLNSMRSVPAIAIIPFFLLWFGFSEVGRIILVVTGIAFNIAIATYQVLNEVPEKYRILFKSFGIESSAMLRHYLVPRIMESLLPTVRFSLSTAMGVVIASELLGSQIGLGYLMQTARNTFSMHVIFLSMLLLGVLNGLFDYALTRFWTRAVYWR